MLSRKIRTILEPSLLVCAFLAMLDVKVLAASSSVSQSGVEDGSKKPFLTNTILQGSARHYKSSTASTPSENASIDFESMIARLEDGPHPWKQNVVTTVFWIGERAAGRNPVPNIRSAWDISWGRHYGGRDKPTRRANFVPTGFIPRQNPFYVALPYNDVNNNHTRLEAACVIPWFKNSFVRDGESVCKDHWLAIRHGNRTCYAQWEDVGPFQVDDWQYVFGNERPLPNRNQNAGLDVSPAVRDYLGMFGMDVCDWRFVGLEEVPNGPWALYGDNNTVFKFRRHGTSVTAKD